MNPGRRFGVCVAAAGLSVFLTGILTACQANSGPVDQGTESDSSAASIDGFAELFEGSSGDYDPVESPRALAKYAELVVTGRIVDVIPGRVVAAANTVTFVVAVDDEATEARKPAVVHVEMEIPGNLPASEVGRHVPRDMQVAFFLAEAPTADEIPIVDERAGRPAGMPLYIPVSPQAFWVADSKRVLQPLEHQQEFAGADIVDFLPPADEWPAEFLSPGDGGTDD